MPTWYQEQLAKLRQNTVSVDTAEDQEENIPPMIKAPEGQGPVIPDDPDTAWLKAQGQKFSENVQMLKPAERPKPKELNDVNPILSPAYTFGKQAWGELWYNMLPSFGLSVMMGAHETLENLEWLADNTVGRIPGMTKLDAFLAEKVGKAPKLSEVQKKYLLDDAIEEAQYARQEGAKFTSDLVNTWDEAKGVGGTADWVFGSLGKMTTQIGMAIATRGASAIGQSAGNVYLDNLERVAKENNITVQQVVDLDLDEPVIAMMAGGISGLVELAGAKGTAGITSPLISNGVRQFMNSPAGKVFRNKMAAYSLRVGGATALEGGTELVQSGVERSGTQISLNDSFEQNINRVKMNVTSPDAIAEYKESVRQGMLGGGVGRAVGIAAGTDDNLSLPQGPLATKYSLNVLVPDATKHGKNAPRGPMVKQASPDKADNPTVVNSYTRMEKVDDEIVLDKEGNIVRETVNELDSGLVDQRTGKTAIIEQVIHPSGLVEKYYFNGELLKAKTAQEATQEVLNTSAAESMIVYPVTGTISIEKAATNEDGTIVYSSGLVDSETNRSVMITENPNAEGPQFSAYNGGVTGNTAIEVAEKINDIGTPKVTDAQGKRANEIFNVEGVSKDTLTRVYKNVFGYSKEQATKMANSMMNKIDQRIAKVKRETTSLELSDTKKKKPTVLTPSQAFNQIAAETHNENVKSIRSLIEAAKSDGKKPQVSKQPVGNEMGITSVDESVKQVEGLTPEQEQESAKLMTDDFVKVMSTKGTAKEKLSAIGRFLRDNLGWKVEKIKVSKKEGRLEITADGKTILLPKGKTLTEANGNTTSTITLQDIIDAKHGIVKAPVETAPVETAPVETAPVETAPVETETKPKVTPEMVHAAAKDAGIDYNTDAFKDVSEKLTGKQHLDDMTEADLQQMLGFIDFHKKRAAEEEAEGRKKDQEKKDREKKDQEKKDQEKKDQEKKDREKQDRGQKLIESLNKAKTVREGLQMIADEGDHKYSHLAAWLLKYGDQMGLDVPVRINKKVGGGIYYPSFDSIMNTHNAGTYVFIHEAIHAFISKKLSLMGIQSHTMRHDAALFKLLENPNLDKNVANLIKAYRIAKGMFKTSRKDGTKRPYGVTNLDEFIAEGLTNAAFQRQLNEVPFPNSNKSVWKTLVDAIKNIIGLPVKEGSMFEAFLHDAGELVAMDRANAKRPGSYNPNIPVTPVVVAPIVISEAEKQADFQRQVDKLPKSQKITVSRVTREGGSIAGVMKFGDKVNPVVSVKNKAGATSYVTYKGDVYANLDKAVSMSLIKKKPEKPKTPQQHIEQTIGNTSETQPSMQPASKQEGNTVASTPATVVKTEPPLPPTRKPEDQPSANPESTSHVVMITLNIMFGAQTSMNKADMIDFIANLDEFGRALGPAKALAIIEHMKAQGYVKERGKQLDLNFPDETFEAKRTEGEEGAEVDDEDVEIGGVELGDPHVDYLKASKEAVEEAKRAAGDTIAEQEQKDMIDSVREFINDAPDGLKNDFLELTKAVGEVFGVSIGAARGFVEAAKSTSGLLKGVTAAGEVKGALDAFLSGRSGTLRALGKGLSAQLSRIANIEGKDFINPISYARGFSAITSSIAAFWQAGVKLLAGDFEAQYITPRMMKFADWVADMAKRGVVSKNILIRNATLASQGIFRVLAYTGAEVRSRKLLRGKREEGGFLAAAWMDNLYSIIGRNAESLSKIHAVLDPKGYKDTPYKGTTYASLSEKEKSVYSALRVNMDNLHNWSLKMKYIDQKTFLKFVNEKGEINYFGRDYQEFYERENLGEDFGEVANAVRADMTIYKYRQEFDSLKGVSLLNDPIYIAAQRMATALQNQAVTEYAESVYNNKKIPRFASKKAWEDAGSPKGFTQLGKHGHGTVYGPLTGMYVPLHIGYDFKGFFMNNMMNSFYTGLKKMDRWWLRRKQKEILTVYNPAINIGNQASNYTFAFLNGIDTMNFNIGLQLAKTEVKEKGALYQKLLAEGLIGTGILKETKSRVPEGLKGQDEAMQKKADANSFTGKIGKKLGEVRTRYSEIDDRAKIAAYWVKTEVYGMSHEQAITEIGQGFQDYDSVGMYYDIYSKLPAVGNVFAKFAGDLARIVTTNGFMRPLTTISYLGMMKLIGIVTSELSDEDEAVEEIRKKRAFQPKIPVPFFDDISLGWMFGKHEIQVGRFVAPYMTYDKGGSDEGIWTATELLPFRFAVMSSRGKPGYAKFDDPMFGTIASIFTDREFRNISISDPKKILAGERGATIIDVMTPEFWSKYRMMNRLNFYFRSWGFIPATAGDLYSIHTSGEDYYGRKKDFTDRMISTIIRVEEFSTPEARQAVMREIQSRSYEINGISKDVNAAFWHYTKQAEMIAQKNITPEQKTYQIQQNWDAFYSSLGDTYPRLNRAAKDLYEPASYLKALQGNVNEVKVNKP